MNPWCPVDRSARSRFHRVGRAVFIALWMAAALSGPVVRASPALPPQRVAPPLADTGWQPTPAQVRRLLQQTRAYYAARDGGRLAEAYAQFSDAQRRTVPLAGWSRQVEAFLAEAGTPRGRQVRQVTWYRDPPQAPPGLYAAVDVTGRFDRLALACGFLAWREAPDGRFEVVHEAFNRVTRDVAARMTPQTLAQARARFNC